MMPKMQTPYFHPMVPKSLFFSKRDAPEGEIYVMNADGSDQNPLLPSEHSDTNPAWSPDGKRIAFNADTPAGVELRVMGANGGTAQTLARKPR